MRIRYIAVLTVSLLMLSGCSSAQRQNQGEIPNYSSAEASCAVVFIGLPPEDGEAVSDRMKAIQLWSRLAAVMSDHLYLHLKENYCVYKFENKYQDIDIAKENLAQALQQSQSNRIIQITYSIEEDTSGPYFEFVVWLYHAKPTVIGGKLSGYNLETLYARKYRYERTPEGIKKFMNIQIDELANRMRIDIQIRGQLAGIKKK